MHLASVAPPGTQRRLRKHSRNIEYAFGTTRLSDHAGLGPAHSRTESQL